MKILGIDPGIARVGWGVIEENKGKIKSLGYDCFETKSSETVGKRLDLIHKEILRIIDEYSPDAMSIEELFFNDNAKTAFVVGQARGVILLASEEKKVPSFIYTPLQVKIAVTGYGRAEKSQIGSMVKIILSLPGIPKPDDTSDALAAAIAHALSHKSLSLK